MAPLTWRYSGGSVSALTISVILSSSVWWEITVGWTLASVYPSKTSFYISSSLMCPLRSGVLVDLVGEFLDDST